MDDSKKSNDDMQFFFAGDLGEQLRYILVVSVIVSAVWLVVGFIGYRVLVSPSESGLLAQAETAALAEALSEESYYRGAYDMCVHFGVIVFGLEIQVVISECVEVIGSALSNDWRSQPSPGWTWPLPDGGS